MRTTLHLVLLAIADGARLLARAPAAGSQGCADVCHLRGGAIERTYAMIKPDVAGNSKAVSHIRELITESGLTIEREERCRLSKTECEAFYAEHSERPFFPGLVAFMSSGPIIKLQLEGKDAVRRWRELIGPTNSEAARAEAPGSVRALYGKDVQRNAAHGSDSPTSAARELALMFQ